MKTFNIFAKPFTQKSTFPITTISVLANNLQEAFLKAQKAYPDMRVLKSTISLSDCHIDYSSSELKVY